MEIEGCLSQRSDTLLVLNYPTFFLSQAHAFTFVEALNDQIYTYIKMKSCRVEEKIYKKNSKQKKNSL